MRILIDRCLERYAVTHATSIVPQSVKWGPHRFELPVAQRRYDSPREAGVLHVIRVADGSVSSGNLETGVPWNRLVLGCEVDKGALPCGSVRLVEQSNRSCC